MFQFLYLCDFRFGKRIKHCQIFEVLNLVLVNFIEICQIYIKISAQNTTLKLLKFVLYGE